MNKVKITADGMLAIIKEIFSDEEVDCVIDEITAPDYWKGKTLQEAMNVEYYTFKHRPISSEAIIVEKMRLGEPVSLLYGLTRSFCLVSLAGVERIYSKDVDMLTLSVTLEYWLQTSKIKLLEDLIEECNIKLSGWRIPVQFGKETRQAVVIFDRPVITDIQPTTQYGEMAVCEINVNMLLYPDVASYKDYEVRFKFMANGKETTSEPIPLSSFSAVNAMTQEPVPCAEKPHQVGSINLSRATSFVLVFDGYNNDFINYLSDRLLSNTNDDNNEIYEMTISRITTKYTHFVVIKDHQITVNADTGNETHTLSLVTRGVI